MSMVRSTGATFNLRAGDDLADLIADGMTDWSESTWNTMRFPGANAVHLVGRQRTMSRLATGLPADDASGRHRDELQDRKRGTVYRSRTRRRRNSLAAFDGEIDAIHRMHDAVVGGNES